MRLKPFILSLFILLFAGCGAPVGEDVKPDDPIKDSSKSKVNQEDEVDDAEDDQATVASHEVSAPLVAQNEDTTEEEAVAEAEVVPEDEQDAVSVEVIPEDPAEESEVMPEDAVEEAPKKKEKKTKNKVEMAGPYCPAFVETQSKKLLKWIERVESMNLPDLGKYPITAKFNSKDKKHEDHRERFQKTYAIKIPKKLDVLKGNAGTGEVVLVLRDGPREKVTCLYQGKATGKKLRCDGKNTSYEFVSCSNGLEVGHLFRANFIRLHIKGANESCESTEVEMNLKLQSARSPKDVACGDVITETTELTENLKCAAKFPVALTIVGDGIVLKGKGKTIEVANDKRTAILILGQKNKVRNVKLRGTKAGLGIVAFEETATNQCKRIKEVSPDMSSMGMPEVLFRRIGAFFAVFIQSIRQLFH